MIFEFLCKNGIHTFENDKCVHCDGINYGNFTDKKKLYLYHLMFNDAVALAEQGMNHNAMDRSCMFDVWCYHTNIELGLNSILECERKAYLESLDDLDTSAAYELKQYAHEMTERYLTLKGNNE